MSANDVQRRGIATALLRFGASGAGRDSALGASLKSSETSLLIPGRAPPPAETENADIAEWNFVEAAKSLEGTQRRWVGATISFVLMVVLPFAGIMLYAFKYAAPQYASEFRFSVTEVSQSGQASSGSAGGSTAAAASVASSLLGGAPMGGSSQNYVVVDFIKSRQAVSEILKEIDLREIYTRPEADWWARLPDDTSRERLVDYWRQMVTATYDPATGLARAEVRAFRPEDAFDVTRILVRISERLVNTIARRSQDDIVKFSERELNRAKEELERARSETARYRAREGVIDPTQSVVSSNVAVGLNLRTTLSSLQTDLSTLQSQRLSEDSPPLQAIRSRIKATEDELKRVERDVGTARGGRESLERVVAEFERLEVNRQYAQNRVVTATQMLDQAKANAASQHLYLTPYVAPDTPESPAGPDRRKMLILGGMALFAIWLVSLLTLRSIRQSLA